IAQPQAVRAVNVAAPLDHMLAARRGPIQTESEAQEHGVAVQVVEHPRCAQALHIEREGKPPLYFALVLFSQRRLPEELGGNSALGAKRLDVIVQVEALRFILAALPRLP